MLAPSEEESWRQKLSAEETKRRALESRVAELETRANASSRFLAVISHEIRNALNGALGMAEVLAKSELNEEQSARVQVIRESGESLRSLVNDILDYSKLQEGRLQLEQSPFQIASMVRGCVAMAAGDAEKKGLELRLDLHPEGTNDWALGDSGRLRQVALNLLHNAIKFTDNGGIEVRCEIHDAEQSSLPTRFRFSVKDSGIGLSAAEQEALFHPFAKTLTANSRPRGGAGLGLAICYRLIESMGGAIGVESCPGEGATFWVDLTLPKASPTAVDSENSWHSADHSQPMQVLVADDSRVNLRIAEAMLRHMGHSPHCVANGAEALRAVEDSEFDIVFMDLWMPEMDGVEATRRIRQLSGTKAAIPIVALTANAAPSDHERCADAGMDGLVSKPIQPKDLRQAIQKYSQGRSESPNAGNP